MGASFYLCRGRLACSCCATAKLSEAQPGPPSISQSSECFLAAYPAAAPADER